MVVVRKQYPIACLKPVAFWALAIALSASPIRAQKGSPSTGGSGGSRGPIGGGTSSRSGQPPTQPATEPNPGVGVLIPSTEPRPKAVVVEDETCLPWELSEVRGATVSAIRLGVPGKARSQYEKACGAFKKKKLTEAEQHVRDAIQEYPNYLAAWVMLGQVLQDQEKISEAHEACSQAVSIDPTYLPPYLCLAGLLDREKQWGDLLTWSQEPAIFAAKNLAGDMYAYYYRGTALFHLRNFPEAEQSVSQAIAIDKEHHHPEFYFLRAQIYGEQGDLAGATLQIQQFLKISSSQKDKDAARKYLSELQSQQNSK